MVLPGAMALAMPEEIFPHLDNPDLVYPALVFNLLPTVLKGLVLAGLLAAMSSSISATLNSASTLITMDFISKFKPDMTSKQLVRAGQLATIVLVVLAALWAPRIKEFDSLFKYLQQVLAYIAPPVVAAFFLGLFWKRANGNGAFYGFVISALLAILYITNSDAISQSFLGIIPGWVLVDDQGVHSIHFLHQAFILFIIALMVIVGISLATAPPEQEKIQNFVYTRKVFDEDTASLKGLVWYKNYRIIGMILLIITAILVFAWI